MNAIEERIQLVNEMWPAESSIHARIDEMWWAHICKRVGGYLDLVKLVERSVDVGYFRVMDDYWFFDGCGWYLYSFTTMEEFKALVSDEEISA